MVHSTYLTSRCVERSNCFTVEPFRVDVIDHLAGIVEAARHIHMFSFSVVSFRAVVESRCSSDL